MTPMQKTNTADNCPIIVGVGQITEAVPDDLNDASSPADLAGQAAAAALLDTEIANSELGTSDLATQIDTIVCNRLFADSIPNYPNPFGGPNNLPRAVANRIKANPKRAIYPDVGGHIPQKLVNEFAEQLAHGNANLVLLTGAEVSKNSRAAIKQGVTLDWSEKIDGELTDAGFNLFDVISQLEIQHGMDMPALYYALTENARRALKQQTPEAYMQDMANTFSRFSSIAANNPYANDQSEYNAEFIATPSDKNPLICSPYTRALVARESVNQGAAILMTTIKRAKELGIAKNKWVYLHGYCDVKDTVLLERPELGHSSALEQVLLGALANTNKNSNDIDYFDIYSCFPTVVTQTRDVLGLAPDDPRPLTQTGGLPFFGGPGNNYSMHGIASTIEALRQDSGAYGLVLANGGFLSKFSAGVYSTTPIENWSASSSLAYQNAVENEPRTPIESAPNGAATIETYTVHYKKGTPVRAIIIGRMADSSKRFYAVVSNDEAPTMQRLTDEDAIGQSITVASDPKGNSIRFS